MSPDSEQRVRFTGNIRKKIKKEQGGRCQICGDEGHLTIHHKNPIVKGGRGDIENGVGLCRGPDTKNCHDIADILTIKHGIPFEQIMQEGVEYWINKFNINR